MLPMLETFAHPTPRWLLNLSPADIQRGPAPWRKHLVKDALVYPGAGLDGSPVRQCNGAIHSFIFLDYGTPKAEVLAELTRPRRTGTGFAHHQLVALSEFDPTPLLAGADQAFVYQRENNHQSQPPTGLWAVYESRIDGRTERMSFLFIGAEAIQALAALFPSTAPRALVVQEHGFGGNCWGSFSGKIRELATHWNSPPEFLVLGSNHDLHAWQSEARALGEDVAKESMHQNVREFLWLGPQTQPDLRRGRNTARPRERNAE